MNRRIALAIASASVIIITSCGINATNSSTVNAIATVSTEHTAPATSASSQSPSLNKIGSTFTVTGNDITDYFVTLTKLEQNAKGVDEFNRPGTGYHLVAAIFTVKGDKQTAQDDANNDVIVLGSDKQLYNFDTDNITGYTNFNGGDFTVSPGEEIVGAVVFKLPVGVTAAKVIWAAPLSSSTAVWNAD